MEQTFFSKHSSGGTGQQAYERRPNKVGRTGATTLFGWPGNEGYGGSPQ